MNARHCNFGGVRRRRSPPRAGRSEGGSRARDPRTAYRTRVRDQDVAKDPRSYLRVFLGERRVAGLHGLRQVLGVDGVGVRLRPHARELGLEGGHLGLQRPGRHRGGHDVRVCRRAVAARVPLTMPRAPSSDSSVELIALLLERTRTDHREKAAGQSRFPPARWSRLAPTPGRHSAVRRARPVNSTRRTPPRVSPSVHRTASEPSGLAGIGPTRARFRGLFDSSVF